MRVVSQKSFEIAIATSDGRAAFGDAFTEAINTLKQWECQKIQSIGMTTVSYGSSSSRPVEVVSRILVVDPLCDFTCASDTLFSKVIEEFNLIVAREMAGAGRRLAFDWSSLQLSKLVKIGKVIITGDGTEEEEEERTITEDWDFDGSVRGAAGWLSSFAVLLSILGSRSMV